MPTYKTAILAGAWCSLGFVPFEVWMNKQHFSALENNIYWLIAAMAFLFVPAVYLVFGRNAEPFSRTWFLNAEERSRYWVVVKRMFAWLMGAAIFGALWSAVLGFVFGYA